MRRRLETCVDLDQDLDALAAADPRLGEIRRRAGQVPLRHRPAGFEGLARMVVGQMVSVASATAIWNRLEADLAEVTPERFLQLSEAEFTSFGLSRAKIRTLTGLADAALAGMDFDALANLQSDEAITALTALPGIGKWTAEVYLLFSAREADVFPAGDLALQVAAMEGLALAARPREKELRRMAEAWSPWRSAAARLLWTYYTSCRKGGTALPV